MAMLPNMDPDHENVIQQARGDALAAGFDHIGQTVAALQAVQWVRPDMTTAEALSVVNRVQQE